MFLRSCGTSGFCEAIKEQLGDNSVECTYCKGDKCNSSTMIKLSPLLLMIMTMLKLCLLINQYHWLSNMHNYRWHYCNFQCYFDYDNIKEFHYSLLL